MKEYKDIPQHLKNILEYFCLEDNFGLIPANIYKNIKESVKSIEVLSNDYNLKPEIIKEIKEV